MIRLFVLLVALVLGVAAGERATAQEITPPDPGEGRSAVEVRVSFLLADLIRIADFQQTIELDLYYRLQWRDDRLAREGEGVRFVSTSTIWVPDLQAQQPRGVTRLLPELAVVAPDGEVTYTQRLSGDFGAPTNLADFPFDSHVVRIPFAFATASRVEIEAVEGPIVEGADSPTVPNWTVGKFDVSLDPIVVTQSLPPFPGATISIEVERRRSYYLTSILFPLIVIVMMSWTVFWAPPTNIAVQFGFAATSILTVIAYRFALANQIPPVPYSTRLDTFLTGSFVMAFLALVEVVVTARLIYREHVDVAESLDRTCRWAFPVALVGLGLFAFAT